jgi:tRNA/tmRNA/rRNA uracil-C5-methylase (TrmA/RlmC/RlmD family)
VRQARLNVPEARFVAADLSKNLSALPAAADIVVLDPPRKGAGEKAVRAVANMAPRAVAYVACDPAALARDLAFFAKEDYAPSSIRAFDLFPMTHHVECVAVLTRSDADSLVRLSGGAFPQDRP